MKFKPREKVEAKGKRGVFERYTDGGACVVTLDGGAVIECSPDDVKTAEPRGETAPK